MKTIQITKSLARYIEDRISYVGAYQAFKAQRSKNENVMRFDYYEITLSDTHWLAVAQTCTVMLSGEILDLMEKKKLELLRASINEKVAA